MRGEDYYSYSSLVYYDGFVYYFTEVGGKLIKVNVSTCELNVVFQIGNDNEYLPYRKLVLCKDVIYLIPYYRTSLISFNLSTEKRKVIEFPDDVVRKVGNLPQYFGAYRDGDLIYMYGFNQAVTRYDIAHDEFFVFEPDIKDYQFSTWFRSGCCKINNNIYIPFCDTPYTLIINGDYCEIKKINIHETKDFSFTEIMSNDNSICYLRENEAGNVLIDVFEGSLTDKPFRSFEIKLNDGIVRNKTEIPFLTGSIIGDELILLPGNANVFIYFNLKTGKYKNISMDQCLSENGKYYGIRCFFDVALDGDSIYSLLYRKNILIKINTGEISQQRINISEADKMNYINTNCIIYEEKHLVELDDYISGLQQILR